MEMIHDTPMEIMKVFLNCFAFEEVDSVQLDIDIDMQAFSKNYHIFTEHSFGSTFPGKLGQ